MTDVTATRDNNHDASRLGRAVVAVAMAAGVTFGTIGAIGDPAAAANRTSANATFSVANSYSHSDPKVHCYRQGTGLNFTGARWIWVDTPSMWAQLGSTTQASWQPVLYRWNLATRSWVQASSHAPVLFGHITPAGTSPLPVFDGWTVNDRDQQFMRVAIHYRWYYNGQVVASHWTWAGSHSVWGPGQPRDVEIFRGEHCYI